MKLVEYSTNRARKRLSARHMIPNIPGNKSAAIRSETLARIVPVYRLEIVYVLANSKSLVSTDPAALGVPGIIRNKRVDYHNIVVRGKRSNDTIVASDIVARDHRDIASRCPISGATDSRNSRNIDIRNDLRRIDRVWIDINSNSARIGTNKSSRSPRCSNAIRDKREAWTRPSNSRNRSNNTRAAIARRAKNNNTNSRSNKSGNLAKNTSRSIDSSIVDELVSATMGRAGTSNVSPNTPNRDKLPKIVASVDNWESPDLASMENSSSSSKSRIDRSGNKAPACYNCRNWSRKTGVRYKMYTMARNNVDKSVAMVNWNI